MSEKKGLFRKNKKPKYYSLDRILKHNAVYNMIIDYRGKEGKAEARSGVHLEKAEFTLSLAREYVNFLNMLKAGYLYRGQKHI